LITPPHSTRNLLDTKMTPLASSLRPPRFLRRKSAILPYLPLALVPILSSLTETHSNLLTQKLGSGETFLL